MNENDLILRTIYVSVSDVTSLLELQEKNGVKRFNECYLNDRAAALFNDYIGETLKVPVIEALAQANYFALLSDGSTDKGVMEDEVVYVLYLKKNGRVAVQFLSVENPRSVDAGGIKDCIRKRQVNILLSIPRARQKKMLRVPAFYSNFTMMVHFCRNLFPYIIQLISFS